MSLGLAIPFFNEEAVCEPVVRALSVALIGARIPHTMALVDNGSTDGTARILNRLAVELPNLRVMHLEVNAGYGGGILAGMRQLETPVVGWCWGDGQVAPVPGSQPPSRETPEKGPASSSGSSFLDEPPGLIGPLKKLPSSSSGFDREEQRGI